MESRSALQTREKRVKLSGSSLGNEAGQEPWNSYPIDDDYRSKGRIAAALNSSSFSFQTIQNGIAFCEAYVSTHGLKLCNYCGQDKPATAKVFVTRSKGGKEWLRPICRDCKKAQDSTPEAREKRNARTRAYRSTNKGKVQTWNRGWYERFSERSEVTPELRAVRNEKKRENRTSNPEKVRAAERDYLDRNPEVGRAKWHRRRSRLLSAEGQHTSADIRRQYLAQNGKCWWCRVPLGESYHVDHRIALAQGGSNGPENLVCSCAHCNTSKRDRMPWEFAEGRLL